MSTEIEPLFKSREIATIIWALLFVMIFLFSSSIRRSLYTVIKSFFAWKIQLIVFESALYIVSIIYLLHRFSFWDFTMLKDCILWFLFSALPVLFKLPEASNDKKFFKKLLLDIFKLTVVFQFIVNTHNFGLVTEIIIVPIIMLIAILNAFSETKEKYKSVALIMSSLLVLIGITFFTFAIIDISGDLNKYASYKILKSFLLPIVLAISFVPNAYFIAMFMAYESLFTRLKFFIEGKGEVRYAKWIIVKTCNIRLSRVSDMSLRINYLYSSITREDIKKVLMKPKDSY